MSISALVKAALNKIGNSLPELSKGYNSLLGNVQLGDLIDDAGKSSSVTLAAATTTVVADTSVKAGDKILVQATDTAGAALTGVFVDTLVAGVSFTINHSIAAGTEVFNYQIGR